MTYDDKRLPFGVSQDMRNRYTKEMLEPIVKASTTMAQVCRTVGLTPSTGSQSYLRTRINDFDIDTSHFNKRAWNLGRTGFRLKAPEAILVAGYNQRPNAKLTRRAMIAVGMSYQCVKCGNDGYWNGEPLTLEVDHINNDWSDNRRENVQFMCPNCHGQKTGVDGSKSKRCVTFSRPICIPAKTKVMADPHWRTRLHPERRKVVRPNEDTLRAMVWQTPATILAAQLGVSDVMIGKWCRQYGIPRPSRGYWAKMVRSTGHDPARV